jgi:adenosylcobinamide kinase/adenosylcobinamide-phosphate guanylyltransferase
MGQLILVLGGARSGKSAFAQRLAQELGGEWVLFVATADTRDEEMRARIEVHRRARPAGWRTLEATSRVGEAIATHGDEALVVLVDCLTLLVSNAVLSISHVDSRDTQAWREAATNAVHAEVGALLAWHEAHPATLIVVSNEVGLGLVPTSPLGRLYRDLLGWVNQMLAARSDQVYWMVAGLPVELRSLQSR